MSAIDTLGGASLPPSATPNGFSDLSSEEFLEIIFAELSNQDPLEPQDTQALLEQLGSLRDIESDLALQQQLETLVDQNGFAAAAGLIGSLVSGITTDGRRTADLVLSVSQTADGPVLNLFDGSRMLFENVDEIVGPLDLDVPDDDTDGDGNGDDNGDGDGDGNGNGDGGGGDAPRDALGGTGVLPGSGTPPVSNGEGALPGLSPSPPVTPLRPREPGIAGDDSRPGGEAEPPSLLEQLRGLMP